MLKEVYNQVVEELAARIRGFYGQRLVSLCVFGSVARGTMHDSSDIDLLIVADPLP
ncbi:MAG: nucleotidyltransferase domain-containing protein [Sedimentisphaerales bacterium]|jgi:predicted nucleotidyltransferase|nr:nucleotidyltransferase domain-containing protein [Sedimentisphaerales bacterium]